MKEVKYLELSFSKWSFLKTEKCIKNSFVFCIWIIGSIVLLWEVWKCICALCTHSLFYLVFVVNWNCSIATSWVYIKLGSKFISSHFIRAFLTLVTCQHLEVMPGPTGTTTGIPKSSSMLAIDSIEKVQLDTIHFLLQILYNYTLVFSYGYYTSIYPL